MVASDALLITLFHLVAITFVMLWTTVFRRAPAAEGPSTDHISLSSHDVPRIGRAPSGRRRHSEPKVLTREEAHARMFSKRMEASVWHWLQRLGIETRHLRDVSQDVFEQAARSFPTYDPMKSRPERWLNKVAVFTAAHFLDRAWVRKETLLEQDPDELPGEAPDPGDLIDSHRLSGLAVELLQTLEPDLRRVVVAHEIDGISMVEIAAAEGIPLSTAYKRRARGLAALAAEEGKDEQGLQALLTAKALLLPVQGCSEGPQAVHLVMGGVSCAEPPKSR